jgi:hypothetical protein
MNCFNEIMHAFTLSGLLATLEILAESGYPISKSQICTTVP